jgi:general secretion pathway protein J
LFSLLCTLLFGNMRFGVMAWERGSARADWADHMVTVQGFLRRTFEGAYPLFLADDPSHPHVDFDGTERSLAFVGPAPIAAGSGGRYRYAFTVEPHGARAHLVMAASPELADAQNPSSVTRTALLADVEDVEFAYFGTAPSGDTPQWQNVWTRRTTLPRLVRVQARLQSGDARAWPPLVVAPCITADVSCVFDPLTKRCRGR